MLYGIIRLNTCFPLQPEHSLIPQFQDDQGVFIYGLFLDGATWDASAWRLNNAPLGHRFTIMPEIYLRPIRVLTDEGVRESSVSQSLTDFDKGGGGRGVPGVSGSTPRFFYDCPVYKTTMRTNSRSSNNQSANFVTSLLLPSNAKPGQWTMRGVALVAQLDT